MLYFGIDVNHRDELEETLEKLTVLGSTLHQKVHGGVGLDLAEDQSWFLNSSTSSGGDEGMMWKTLKRTGNTWAELSSALQSLS